MNEMQVIESRAFGDIQCDIYGNGYDYFMTREQIGTALEYSDARIAIAKIHRLHEERLNHPDFSTVTDVVTVDGKKRKVTVYSRKGIMEICRHSDQPKANVFMDWVWDIMDTITSNHITKEQINAAIPYLKELFIPIEDFNQLKQDFSRFLTTTIDYQQAERLKRLGAKTVINIFGGKTDEYRLYGKRLFGALWSAYKKEFGLTSYRDTSINIYENGLKFVANWEPDESLLIELDIA